MIEIIRENDDETEFALKGENLGIANLVVEKLLTFKSVSFAATKVDHPLFNNPHIVVRAKNPKAELKKAFEEVVEDAKGLEKEIKKLK